MRRVTFNRINEAIRKTRPHVGLTRSPHGFFYIYSDDPETAREIESLPTNEIDAYRLYDFTLEQWVEQVDLLFINSGRYGLAI